MKKNGFRLVVVCIGCLLMMNNLCFALDSANALSYLHFGVGARALGMGGAFTAVADDGTCAYWNPAGLTKLRSLEITSTYALLSVGRSLNFVSCALPLGFLGTPSVSWINSGYSGVKGFTGENTAATDVKNSNNAFIFSYGFSPSREASVGISAKMLLSELSDKSGLGMGIDAGVLLNPIPVLSVGLTLQDIASVISWNTDSKAVDTVPMNILGGVSYTVGENLVISAGINKNIDMKNLGYNIGAEYKTSGIGVRAGLNNGNPAIGLSYKFLFLQLDYAYNVDSLKEGDSHIVSLNTSFSNPKLPSMPTLPSIDIPMPTKKSSQKPH